MEDQGTVEPTRDIQGLHARVSDTFQNLVSTIENNLLYSTKKSAGRITRTLSNIALYGTGECRHTDIELVVRHYATLSNYLGQYSASDEDIMW